MGQELPRLIVIVGPTAVGKTQLCFKLSKKWNLPILSADSRQIYRELNIGTAKPSSEELSLYPHLFINHRSIHDHFTVKNYEGEVIDFLSQWYRSHDLALLSGGTGLYVKAVLEGLDDIPTIAKEHTAFWEKQYEANGIEYLQNALHPEDLQNLNQSDFHNSRRLIRALAVFRQSGNSMSHYQSINPVRRDFRAIQIQLVRDRVELYERINARVDQMLENGLENEARELYAHRHHRPLDTVGYREFFKYFSGIIDREEAVRLIKRNTRRYAKRQITWFKNQAGFKEFHPDNEEAIIQYIHQFEK